MTNDEIRRNTEILMTNEPLHTSAPFDIRASDFFRHLSIVIRHSTGSWSQCMGKKRKEVLHEQHVAVSRREWSRTSERDWRLSKSSGNSRLETRDAALRL